MILTGKAIISGIESGDIQIDPFELSRINPNSYNLRMHDELLIYKEFPLDMKRDNPVEKLRIPKEGLVLEPGILYLGRTIEQAGSSAYIPILEGRSSIGRLGMCVHITANVGNIGFMGCWTLEILVQHPLRVYAGVEVCQVYFQEYKGISTPYNSKYQNSLEVRPSGLWTEFSNVNTDIE